MSGSESANRKDSKLENYHTELPSDVPYLTSFNLETQEFTDHSQSELYDAQELDTGNAEETTPYIEDANESSESEGEEFDLNNNVTKFSEEVIIEQSEVSDDLDQSIEEQSDQDGNFDIDQKNNDEAKRSSNGSNPRKKSRRNIFYEKNLKSTFDKVKAKLEKKGRKILKDQSLDVDDVINVPSIKGQSDVHNSFIVQLADTYYSRGYLHLYVKETEEFAKGEYFGQSSLQSGRVGINHSTTIQKQKIQKSSYDLENDTEEGLTDSFVGGTYWGADEKDRFFTFLGRRSRHNMLGVAQGVRTKSVIECEEYYNLLFRAKADYEENNSPYWKQSYGITMKDIPAAHEMSQEWIDMEEIQAEGLTYHDNSLGITTRSKKRVIKNILQSDFKRSTLETLTSEIDTEDSLLNLPELWKLSNRIFVKAPYDSRLVVEHTGAPFKFISENFYHELTNLVIDRTRSLIEQVIYSCSNLSNIRGAEVSKVAMRMNMPLTSGKYWQQYPRKSRLMLNDRFAIDDENEYYDQMEEYLPIYEGDNNLLTAKDHCSVHSFHKVWRLKKVTQPEKHDQEKDTAFKIKEKELEEQIENAFRARYAQIYFSDEGNEDENSSAQEDNNYSEGEEIIDKEITLNAEEISDNHLHADRHAIKSVRSRHFDPSVSVLEENDEYSSQMQNKRQDDNYFDPNAEDPKKVAIHEQFCCFEEAELEEYDTKNSEDYEYVNLVFMNSFKVPNKQRVVTDDEIRVRVAERVNNRSLKNRDMFRLTALKEWHANSYVNRKRILDEMEIERVEAKVATKKRKLDEKFASQYRKEVREETLKDSSFLREAYTGFLHYFPKQGSAGIIEKPAWKQYESRKFYNDNYFLSNRNEISRQFDNL